MPKVIHFEIPAEDPEIIRRFYEGVFGWKITQWKNQPYWLVEAGAKKEWGINGAIYRKDETRQMDKTVNTIGVEDLEDYIKKVERSGGEIIGEIREIPEVGRFVYAKDPEGTLFGMLEPSEEMMKMM